MARRTKTFSKLPRVASEIESYAKRNPFVLKGRVIEPQHGRTGRPSVMTQEVVRKLEYAFVYNSTVEEACFYAGISRETYYNFCKKFPDFSERISQLRHAPSLVLRKVVLRGAMEDANLAFKYLERKLPQEFGLRASIHHTGDTVDRHSIDPKTAERIAKAMGNWAKKVRKTETVPSLFS